MLFIALAAFAGAFRLWLTRTSQIWAFGFGHDLAVEIQRRFASNDLPDFVTESLAEQGIDLAAIAIG